MIRLLKTKEKLLSLVELTKILNSIQVPTDHMPDDLAELACSSKEHMVIMINSIIKAVKVLILSEAIDVMEIGIEDLDID